MKSRFFVIGGIALVIITLVVMSGVLFNPAEPSNGEMKTAFPVSTSTDTASPYVWPTSTPQTYGFVIEDGWLKFRLMGTPQMIANQKAFFCWPDTRSSHNSDLQSCWGQVTVDDGSTFSIDEYFGPFGPTHGMIEASDIGGKSNYGFGAQDSANIFACAALYYGLNVDGDVKTEYTIPLPSACEAYGILVSRDEKPIQDIQLRNHTGFDLTFDYHVQPNENVVYIKANGLPDPRFQTQY